MKRKGIPWIYIIPAIILIGLIGGLIYLNTSSGAKTVGDNLIIVSTNTPSSLPDVPLFCDQATGCSYHWHDHLDIFVGNRSSILVPLDLGHVGSTNLFAIHTHDTTGIIHLECCSPAKNQTFTLENLFEVWGYSVFDSTHALNYSSLPVTVYVNGVQYTRGPIGSLVLSNHMEIALLIGSNHPANIPSSYSFPAGL